MVLNKKPTLPTGRQEIGSDNAVEDYFFELLITKHIIDKEIKDLLILIEGSQLHRDYQLILKKTLFGEKNLYLENWGTLAGNLLDIIRTENIRSNKKKSYGIVLGMMLRIIEEVFDVDDNIMHEFLLSTEKEDIEHRLIILMKRVLDYMESGLKEALETTENLDEPIEGYVRKEYDILADTIIGYANLVLETKKEDIEALKLSIDTVVNRLQKGKKSFKRA